MSQIWKNAQNKHFQLVKRFKEIFIDQEKDKIYEVFSKDFGIHNGYTLEGYCHYEFEEFALKADRFELTHEAKIECFDIGNNYIYFSLGKKNDKAVFESIFLWDEEENRLKGNQYPYKLEPKIQFYQDSKTKEVSFNRRINIKAPDNDTLVKKILISESSHDFIFFKQELEEIFGGTFYSLLYKDDKETLETYWNQITIFSNKGITKKEVLMRGKDHPLFMDNLFPELTSIHSFKIQDNIYPVIINIEFEDGSDELLKYPLEKSFNFNKKITKICLTDTLSFDWIITNIDEQLFTIN